MSLTWEDLDTSQRRAVELVCDAPLGVVTGGPGTGKTSSMVVALDRLDQEGISVALASPTGKAARRILEATGRDATTVHRLLAYHPSFGFMRNEKQPIAADVVIVDEASMLDVELADSLTRAIQRETRLILVGDADQLPSVGPGRVLGDLIESGAVPVARLTTLHRAAAESWVCTQSRRIIAGEVPSLDDRDDFMWVERESRDDAAEALVSLVTADSGDTPRHDIQVLIPQNVGPAGTNHINRVLQDRLNPGNGRPSWRVGAKEGRQFLREGDRVIQTRNDYHLDGGEGVMNGECGVVEKVGNDALVVRLDERVVRYSPAAAQALRLAYALTIHKSQGSEWPWVVVLCHSTHTRMLSRQLLYTAVTRAKKGIVLVGDTKGLRAAVKNDESGRRNSGLAARLREARAQEAVL